MLSFRARQCMPSPKSFSFSITAAQRQHTPIIYRTPKPLVLHLRPVIGHQRRLAVGASAGLAACFPQCITWLWRCAKRPKGQMGARNKNETLLQTYSAILMRKDRPRFIMERPATGLHPVSLEVEEKHLLPLSYCNVMQHSCEKRLFVRSATISMKICCRNCKSVFTMPHSLCKTTSET